MEVIGAAIHRVQLPTSDATVIYYGLFDQASLLLIEDTCIFGHSNLGLEFTNRVGELIALSA
jgi:hypothetical protein